MKYAIFHPMSEPPMPDKNDESFSETVLVYSENTEFIELGYFDFEDECWYHFGSDSFLLKCWCYIPNPVECLGDHQEWPLAKHKDYDENDLSDRIILNFFKK
ncbi:hypothetical protein [Mesonia aquimarina]|uniref:hypothetical protein n=1 Tax=Mesonia aquimarina TaxID=1504967 RepID=UPI000EF6144E|nr:hypothetical protein [Mesonia aquimarina]